MATRLAPVKDSAIGEDTSDHSVIVVRKADGVRPDKAPMTVFAVALQALMSPKWRIASRRTRDIPSSHQTSRSTGPPPACDPLAPPIASGTNTAPFPILNPSLQLNLLYSP